MDNNLNEKVVVQRTSTLTTQKRFFRYGVYYAFSWLIDYVVYNLVFQHYGFQAIPWMVLSTFVIDLGTLVIYLHYGIDFFDVNGIRDEAASIAESKPKNIFERKKKWIYGLATKATNSWVTAILLSTMFNPFMIVIIMKQGQVTKNSITKRDWKVFFVTFVTGNLYWAAVIAGLFGVIFYAIESFFGINL